MKPRRILFYTRSPMNTVMFRPVVRRLQQLAAQVDMRFSGKPSAEMDSLPDCVAPLLDGGALPPDSLVPRWQVGWRRFDAFVSPDIAMPARRSTPVRVQMFHGVSFKGKAYRHKVRRNFSHVFAVGPYMRRTFLARGIFDDADPALLNIGMPKTDPLVDGSVHRTTVLEDAGLDPSRPTVLYAPTWRKESSLNVEGDAIVESLALPDVNVLVKIHDHCRDPRRNRRDWGAWLDAREDDRVRRVRDADIVPSMVAADLLVSDASSVANEFTLLDRPILFMDVPALFDVYASTVDAETWRREDLGTVVQGAGGLAQAVERALADPAAQGETRRAAAADLFYNPGRATAAATSALLDLLGLVAEGPSPIASA